MRSDWGRWGRAGLAVLVGAIAVVGSLASVGALWANRTLFDPDSVAGAVDLALREPAVTDALAVVLTDQLVDALDRPALAPAVASAVERVVEADRTREVVAAAVRSAHLALLRILDDGSLVDGATVEDGAISVDLLPLLALALERVLDEEVDLPAGDRAARVEAVSEAVGRPLPDDFGRVVVYRGEAVASASTAVATARQAVVLFRRAVLVILVVTAGALAGAVALARDRRRAVLVLLLAVAVAMGVARFAIGRVVAAAPTIAVDAGGREAIATTVEALAGGLLDAVTVALVLGGVLAGAGWLLGKERRRVEPRT